MVLLATTGWAQDDDEFTRYVERAEQQFADFQARADQQFADFLARAWRECAVLERTAPDSLPKPTVAPVVSRPGAPPVALPAPSPPPPTAVDTEPWPLPTAPVMGTRPGESPTVTVTFSFYTRPLTATCTASLVPSTPLPAVNQAVVKSFWETFAGANPVTLVGQVAAWRDSLQLGDWGTYQLVGSLTRALCPADANRSTLLAWCLLTKLGYRTRVACSQGTAYILVATDETLYRIPYLEMAGAAYYAVDLAGQAQPVTHLLTYDGDYPGPLQPLELLHSPPPRTTRKPVERTLSFVSNGVTCRLQVPLDGNAIDYLARFPHTEYDVYFAGAPSSGLATALLAQLRPQVSALPPRAAVDVLLCFVQTAFAYRTDEEQFGRDRPLFPEETLYYPYSDCEDRAALFAWLVRSLLSLPVIGLHYPGHVATAVQFPGPAEGATVTHAGRLYTICDPTYIDATVGMCIPAYANRQPEIIPVRF
jgi:hypothetical protein